ncbi:MAG: arginine--tRNA ligase [Candidatus Saccharimonadales bacterium]
MKREIESVIQKVCKKTFDAEAAVELTRPEEQFGDYSTNIALQLARKLGQPPQGIADQLADALRTALGSKISSITVAGQGFLNVRLSDHSLLESIQKINISKPFAGQKVVIETNNPNPFKDIHIGHAFNSIVADTVANLLESGGAETHRVSYHGDIGLHVGKSMWAILKFIDGDLNKLSSINALERPSFLSQKYAEGATAYEQNELAKKEIEHYAQESFAPSESLFKQVYDICKDWSFSYFGEVFQMTGSHPVERRYLESEADKAGRSVVEEHIGKVFERSDGAIVFPGDRYGLHTRVFISGKGNTLYEARDLGLMQLKQKDFSPQASYIVTAVEQREYFQVIFKAAELALPELAGITKNIPTGTVKLSSGKMSSRDGTATTIGWLFDSLQRALKDRGAPVGSINDEMVGALRYTMLKNRVGSDVTFDVSQAISLEGNSGPYIQYAYVRARSILKKSKVPTAVLSSNLEPGERSLALKISEYPEATERAVVELMPHHICSYLYEVAQAFNHFYENNRVIDNERTAVRLGLVEAYADVINNGLKILNIPAPLQM